MMLGGMFVGYIELGGEMIEENGKKFKLFYGMSLVIVMKKYVGGVVEYRYSMRIILLILDYLYDNVIKLWLFCWVRDSYFIIRCFSFIYWL